MLKDIHDMTDLSKEQIKHLLRLSDPEQINLLLV